MLGNNKTPPIPAVRMREPIAKGQGFISTDPTVDPMPRDLDEPPVDTGADDPIAANVVQTRASAVQVNSATVIGDPGKSAAAAFLDEHEALQTQNAALTTKITEQANELTELYNRCGMLTDQLSKINADKNRYLNYAVQLSSQLQFIVSGAVRAVQVAQAVQAAIDKDSGGSPGIPTVPGADVAELENILGRLAANDPDPNKTQPPQ